jgi:hypothetical protein
LQFWVKFSENNLKANEPHGSQKSFNTRKWYLQNVSCSVTFKWLSNKHFSFNGTGKLFGNSLEWMFPSMAIFLCLQGASHQLGLGV